MRHLSDMTPSLQNRNEKYAISPNVLSQKPVV
jgi:hypothetical protein